MIDATAHDVSTMHPSEALSPRERFKRWRYRNRQALEGWGILTPILVYYSIFFLFPVVSVLYLSFTRWSGLSGAPVWVGLENFHKLLTVPTYTQVIGNTILFAVSILIIQTVLAFFVALLLNAKIRGRGLYRAAWYIPTLTSAAIMAQVASVFIAPSDGVIMTIRAQQGLPPIIFYTQVDLMRLVIIIYSVWRGVGGPMILYLAALQGIHPEFYEAAQVDGATGPQLLRYITLPLVMPMTIFVLITGIIGTAQIFESVMFLSKGGPANLTNVLLLEIYQDAFSNMSIGLASAEAVLLGVGLLAFSLFNIRIMTRGRVGE